MRKNFNVHTFFLIAQAGFPFFTGDFWLLAFFSLAAIAYFSSVKMHSKFIARFVYYFIVLMLIQSFILGNFLLGPFLGFILRIIYAYMVIRLAGVNFMRQYVTILKALTVIAIIAWVMLSYIPGVYESLHEISVKFIRPLELYPDHVRDNLIFYTMDHWLLDKLPRNAGPFWEPGAFGVFLVVAIMFQTLIDGRFVLKNNVIFLFGLITTFSFGAYLAFLIFIYAYLLLINKVKLYSLIIIVLVSGFAYWSYNSFDFLGEKWERRYEKSLNFHDDATYENLNYQVGRNEKAILDLRAFAMHPIIGEGQFIEYDFGNSPSGLTSVLRKWGIIGFILLFYNMFRSFNVYTKLTNLNRNYAIVATLTLMAVALTQSLYGKPFFIGLCFLFLVLPINELIKLSSLKHDTT